MNVFIEKFKSYLPYIAGFALVAAIIFYPELQGKKLAANDAVTWHAASKEWKDYHDKGESIFWTNRIFSGMPLYTVASDISGNFITKYYGKIIEFLPNTMMHLFTVFMCCFIGLILLGVNRNFAFILAIALGLNTWVLDSLWASHPTKILSFAFLIPVVAGFIAYNWNKRKINLIAIMFGMLFSIAYGHYQIVYYGAIICLILAIYFFIKSILDKTILDFIKSNSLVLICVGLAVVANISTLLVVEDYNKETMRGGTSEIVREGANSTAKGGGLNFKYAMDWSYSFEELVNFFIPDATGGSNTYKVKTDKYEIAKAINPNETEQVVQVFYWGIQPFTGAPNYLSAIVVFLFIFAMIYWQNRFKYLLLGIVLLSMGMGLGRSFPALNEFLFQYLPMYNKFRTPTMSFSILNMTTILTIGLGLNSLFNGTEDKLRVIKSLKLSAYTMLGLFVFSFIMISNSGYSGQKDLEIFKENKQALDLVLADRASLFKSDFFRSIILICIAAASLFYFIQEKLAKKTLFIILGAILFFDLWSVHKRYLFSTSFEKIDKVENLIPNESYNQLLEQDKSYFRMYNPSTGDQFSSNTDGYRFANVGGYSPAKLYRYQDLIDVHLGKGNMPVLNMLNTKYFIIQGQDGQKQPQQNPDACGNAWFVNEVKFAKNANEEIDSIGTFNPKMTAWVDQRYKSETDFKSNTDATAKIELTKYHPDNMEYRSSSSTGGFAVFSEIWYKGNEDWNLYVNGKPQKLVRTNYLLRGAYIPAGSNKIEMKFSPKKAKTYILMSTIASGLVLVFTFFILYLFYFKKEQSLHV